MEDSKQIISVIRNPDGNLVMVNATGEELTNGVKSIIKSMFANIAKSDKYQQPHLLIEKIWIDLIFDPINDLLLEDKLNVTEKQIVAQAMWSIMNNYLKPPHTQNKEGDEEDEIEYPDPTD